MSDLLGISGSAISAYQRALSTVSNNIANVNTEGYSRQEVVLKDTTPRKMAGMYLGTGVMLQNVRRQFDQFAESNLRNSTSDLSAQGPMVDYTQRVINIMGDSAIGLNSAFDNFFAAADALSADPASTVQRASFLRNADGVASRFGELSSQLEQVRVETQQGMQGVIDEVNNYAGQLALINQSLARAPSLDAQPAELLDRRDLSLRKLSELVRVRIQFEPNGQVNVSLGNTLNEGLLVSGMGARNLGMNTSGGKTEFLLDPYGTPETLASVSGGKLGGYQSFSSQVLNPARQQLDALAQVFVDETNTVQKNGIDGYGQLGQGLFAIDPAADQKAAGVKLAVSDGMRIATAAQFRVSEGGANVTNTRASVRYQGQAPTAALSNSKFVNNPNPTAGVSFKVDGARVYAPVTTLSAGVGATFYLDEMAPGQQLQVLTRDGQQILGKPLTETEKFQLLVPDNGFNPGIHYSDQYLNQAGSKAYRDGDFFYGAKAAVRYQPNYDAQGNALPASALPAELVTARLNPPMRAVDAGALQLNGIGLQAYTPTGTSGVTVKGLSAGTGALGDFQFSMMMGGKTLSVTNLSGATDMASLASSLQAELRAQAATQLADTSAQISVKLLSNGTDLQIVDQAGRAVQSAGFTWAGTGATGVQTGEVSLDGDVAQMARWLNGTTELHQANVVFGTGNPGFSALKMDLGDVDYQVDIPTAADGGPTTLKDLALYLQTELRAQDKSNRISVGVEYGELVLRDDGGRALKRFVLTPHDDAEGASAGRQSLTQSHLAQTGVRAELFSEVKVATNRIDFNKPLSINGVQIGTLTKVGVNNVNDLIASINAANAGVKAELAQDGQLRLSSPLGSAITIDRSSAGNAFNIDPLTYGAQVRTVQESRELRVAASQLDLSRGLTLNGVDVLNGTKPADLGAVMQRIRDTAAQTGVSAYVDNFGDLILKTTDTTGQAAISIGPGANSDGSFLPNLLGMPPKDYDLSERLQRDLTDHPYHQDMRLSFGDNGDPYDLAGIGLRTAAYVEKGCKDDLMLFVTGKGSAKVAVGFEGQPTDPRDSLRTQSLTVKFTALDRYQVIDNSTQTVLAERDFDPQSLAPTIAFGGLQVSLTRAPGVGDTFRIDGNQDGLGNNVNMLDMAELAKKQVIGGKTLHDAYIDQVNDIGNLGQQAKITQQALTVVNEQAVTARDKVSGVNLDDEASALIRYQQAYQAAAKAMQISSQLFDSIVQIR